MEQKKGEFVVPQSHIFIQVDGHSIYPYTGLWQTADKIRENVRNELLTLTSK